MMIGLNFFFKYPIKTQHLFIFRFKREFLNKYILCDFLSLAKKTHAFYFIHTPGPKEFKYLELFVVAIWLKIVIKNKLLGEKKLI